MGVLLVYWSRIESQANKRGRLAEALDVGAVLDDDATGGRCVIVSSYGYVVRSGPSHGVTYDVVLSRVEIS